MTKKKLEGRSRQACIRDLIPGFTSLFRGQLQRSRLSFATPCNDWSSINSPIAIITEKNNLTKKKLPRLVRYPKYDLCDRCLISLTCTQIATRCVLQFVGWKERSFEWIPVCYPLLDVPCTTSIFRVHIAHYQIPDESSRVFLRHSLRRVKMNS